MSDWLPPGLPDYAAVLAAAVDRRLGLGVEGDAAYWLELPRRLGAAGVPAEPVRWGDGALCVDLGPDDAETWERFALVHRNEPDPEAVAVAAQEWRLAVTPYRKLPATAAAPVGVAAADTAAAAAPSGRAAVEGRRIVDMTSMWAGPLCTELLGRAGACVRKVTSAARPDGLAGTPMYAELNAHKATVEIDSRHPAGRRELEDLLGSADLLVTSLSPRALANLDLLPSQLGAHHSGLRTLAITAFEADSPEHHWIAYGSGVHAASGLGWLGDSPQAPAYSYPDPLAGLLAARVAADQLTGALPRHRRVSLAAAVTPLACRAATGSTNVADLAGAVGRPSRG
ncbi:CoA transferase [Candidatus Poriferisodalis sp.]|uniref:CoA transferase n=1 Tax=Candidatus Poriferisodalis sp. TaxID=3101277 RepID=UPI003B011D9A